MLCSNIRLIMCDESLKDDLVILLKQKKTFSFWSLLIFLISLWHQYDQKTNQVSFSQVTKSTHLTICFA